MLKRSGLLSVLPKSLTLSALSEAEWLLIRWPIKSHLSLPGECFLSLLLSWWARGSNVILGMNWMEMHLAMLDISACLVCLDSPIYGKVSLQLPPVARLQASVYTVDAKSLDEIPVVHEYLDVFLDDLPGMPPDRVIKFKIELQPGTAPVYKRPYPMTRNETA
jgi:hypothetical protein